MRDKVKIFTKVGSDLGLPGHKGLSKAWIQQAVDALLRRLNTDYIDLYSPLAGSANPGGGNAGGFHTACSRLENPRHGGL